MIYRCSFAAFEAILLRQDFVRVDRTDSHLLIEKGDDAIIVMEVESVCDFAGLTRPDLDQFWGD